MSWHVCDVYVCRNPICGSEILVIAEPREELDDAPEPTCACGARFDKKPLGVEAPAGAPGRADRGPDEEPE